MAMKQGEQGSSWTWSSDTSGAEFMLTNVKKQLMLCRQQLENVHRKEEQLLHDLEGRIHPPTPVHPMDMVSDPRNTNP